MEYRTRILPEDKREYFKKPLGIHLEENKLKDIDAKHILITVGDVVSLTVRKYDIVPNVSIYDGITERQEMADFADLVIDKGWQETVVRNEAGTISAELIVAVKNALTKDYEIIRVEGEEDLAVVPCILLSPIGTNIIYGVPGKGMMLVITDENIIREAQLLMEMMEEIE